jgi:ubiquinone/menaquinone biosynthesis C-methylase UbiE
MNCDRIAPFYRMFETLAFGTRLQHHRLVFLDAAANKHRALILGDGDGRFTQALTCAYPTLPIDSVDLSPGMLIQARRRLLTNPNVSLTHADALKFPFPVATYDILFTHFFLDCFNPEDLATLIPRISQSLCPKGTWIITDFRQAPGGWRSIYTRAWLNIMYSFFYLATGLKTRHLASYCEELRAAHFTLLQERISHDGLITSQHWQR